MNPLHINIDLQLKKKNKTRYWLAKEINITYQNLTNLCEGKTSSVKFSIIEKICNALNCTPNDIFVIQDKKTDE